jgi:hypothetical protein
MRMTLTVSPTGELVLPAELVPAAPNQPIEAAREGDILVVKPVGNTSKEKCDSSGMSIRDLPVLPGTWTNPQQTWRREDLYGDDGR